MAMALLGRLAGFRMLVVEDETLIAMVVEDYLADFGVIVIEIAGTVTRALEIAADANQAIDGAILDVDVKGQKIFPVADVLHGRGIPFVFATAYGAQGIIPLYDGYPVVVKPFRLELFKQVLLSAFT